MRPVLKLRRRLGWLVVARVVGIVKLQVQTPLCFSRGSLWVTPVVSRPVTTELWSQLFS